MAPPAAVSGTVPPLELPEILSAQLIAEALRASPGEACGLLVGRDRLVRRVVPTANVASAENRYVIPPEEHFAVIRSARADGLEVIGAYHSHPRSSAIPSSIDRDAAFSHFEFVIVGLAPAPHLRAWRLEGGNFVEAGLVRS